MSRGFYSRLALSNMRRNRRVTVPYLLTGVILVMMFYMVSFLAGNPNLRDATRAAQTGTILSMTLAIDGIFSVIMLFYADSFLMKRRKKELGLYNILGMEKKHIGKMLFWETVFACATALVAGIALGMVFSKLLLMVIEKALQIDANLPFYLSPQQILICVVFFGLLYLASLAIHLIQLRINNPVELLRGGNEGEREPKTKLYIAVPGAAALAAGYYLSLTITAPMQALSRFFIAVLLVIAATYLLFTAGTIVILKALRKRKSYYYQTRHFTAVSGLLYRMKQNAVGLASICILATMVLVMISTTVSLYGGIDSSIELDMPRNTSVTLYDYDSEDGFSVTAQDFYQKAEELGYKTEGNLDYFFFERVLQKDGNRLFLEAGDLARQYTASGMVDFFVVTAEGYEKVTGEAVRLAGGHVLAWDEAGAVPDTVQIMNREWTVDGEGDFSGFPDLDIAMPTCAFVVPDEAAIEAVADDYEKMLAKAGYETGGLPHYGTKVFFDVKGGAAAQRACLNDLRFWESSLEQAYGKQEKLSEEDEVPFSVNFRNKTDLRQDANQFYGSFLFMGIFLGVLFMMGTVLIIYYKQMSEGFEDRERFRIMQNVGMSRGEVRASIRSQILIVFFLPLAAAAVHILVAYQMIVKLLACFNMTNTSVFALCTVVTLAAFAAVYAVVYILTARVYYRIVTKKQ